MDQSLGIGMGLGLPWPTLPFDLEHLRQTTTRVLNPERRNACLMGWRTWVSIGETPLPNRLNVVLSSNPDRVVPKETLHCLSLEQALEQLDGQEEIEAIFILGGVGLYAEALKHPRCQRAWVTRIHATFEADATIPQDAFADFEVDPEEPIRHHQTGGIRYSIERWKKKRNEIE